MKNSSQLPLSEIRRSLKIKWYRSPVELKKLKELSQRSDFKGFLHSIGHLGLWFCTGHLTYLHFLQESRLALRSNRSDLGFKLGHNQISG